MLLSTFGNYVNVRFALFYTAVLLNVAAARMFENDVCSMKDSSLGTCRVDRECTAVLDAIRRGEMSARDPVHCGFKGADELICCPSQGVVDNTNKDDDGFVFEKKRELEVSTTTTANGDFWLHLLSTTTTAKPDFWLHLLNTTTTTSTTTTTTPRPLIIGDTELNSNAEFYDFAQILNAGNTTSERTMTTNPGSATNTGNGFTDPSNFNGPQIQDNNVNRQPNKANGFNNNFQNVNDVEWNGNGGGRGRGRGHGRGRGLGRENRSGNGPKIMFGHGPFNAQNAGNPNAASLAQQNAGRGQFQNNNWQNQNPATNVGWPSRVLPQPQPPPQPHPQQQQFANNVHGNRLTWPRQDTSVPNRRNENYDDISELNDLNTAASNNRVPSWQDTSGVGLPNGAIWPSRESTQQWQPISDPIALVNENLINAGMEIVQANLDHVDRVWERQQQFVSEPLQGTTTTIRSPPLTDPFAPFQFRPQTNFVDSNNIDTSDADNESRSTRTTTPRATTRTTPTRTPSSSPTNRLGERPAVAACRLIDEQLSLDLTPQILDGTPVELGEYPHMAAIGYTAIGNDFGPYEFRCGGTLIQRQFILTAAHCVSSRESTPTIVRLGAVNFTDPVELRNAVEVRIKTTHIHPNYSSSRKYDDIALLELESPIEYTKNIFPTCLYTDAEDPPADATLYVTGWGTINTRTRQYSNILLKAHLQIEPLDNCNSTYVENGLNRQLNRGLQETQMCAHDPGFTKDACQGDSGGPLNLVVDESSKKYRIVGIISTGFGCASSIPGVYTRVAAYLDFIESIVWPNSE